VTMRQVLDTTLAALGDPAIGLSARVTQLVALGAPTVRTEFSFAKWAFRQGLRDARTHSVVVRPARGADQTKMLETLHRDGVQEIEVAVETFGATADELQDSIAVVQTALLMVLDALVEYSRAHSGTIVEVLDPVSTSYGEFEGAPSGTSAGFTSRITINERSAQ
jgi:hypothetical protein